MNSPLRLGGTLLSLWLVLLVGLRAEMVVDDAGRFAIDIGSPQTRMQSGEETVIHLLLHEEGETAAYIVSYNDLPAGSAAKLNWKETFTEAMNTNCKSTNSDVVSSGEYRLGDIKGWQFTSLSKDGKLSSRGRYFIVSDRFYQVVFMGQKGSDDSEKCLHFLNSFRVLH